MNKVDKSPVLSEFTFWQRRWISTKLKMRREDPGRRRGRGGVAFSQGVGAAHTVTKAPKGPASVTGASQGQAHCSHRPCALPGPPVEAGKDAFLAALGVAQGREQQQSQCHVLNTALEVAGPRGLLHR